MLVDVKYIYGSVEIIFLAGDYSVILKQESNLPVGVVHCCEVCPPPLYFLLPFFFSRKRDEGRDEGGIKEG
jgi:hypothetical protein